MFAHLVAIRHPALSRETSVGQGGHFDQKLSQSICHRKLPQVGLGGQSGHRPQQGRVFRRGTLSQSLSSTAGRQRYCPSKTNAAPSASPGNFLPFPSLQNCCDFWPSFHNWAAIRPENAGLVVEAGLEYPVCLNSVHARVQERLPRFEPVPWPRAHR